MPERIQLRRTKGWRMPPNTVKVDRSTRFGNPWVVGSVMGTTPIDTKKDAVDAFHAWLLVHPMGKEVARDAVENLKGKNLACWCQIGSACHADVLLEIANS